jgi:hypothetical protein
MLLEAASSVCPRVLFRYEALSGYRAHSSEARGFTGRISWGAVDRVRGWGRWRLGKLGHVRTRPHSRSGTHAADSECRTCAYSGPRARLVTSTQSDTCTDLGITTRRGAALAFARTISRTYTDVSTARSDAVTRGIGKGHRQFDVDASGQYRGPWIPHLLRHCIAPIRSGQRERRVHKCNFIYGYGASTRRDLLLCGHSNRWFE